MKRCLNETSLRILVQALIVLGLNYCNSVLSDLPSSKLQPLFPVLHTTARLIKDLSPRNYITLTLKQLHWLPILARIAFKISILMYHIQYGTSQSHSGGLRSSTRGNFTIDRTNLEFGDRAYRSQDLKNGTVFHLQFVDAHLLLNLNQN